MVDDDENDDTFFLCDMRHHRPHKIQKRAVRRRKHPPLPHVDVRLQLHASRYTEVAANPFSSARRGWPTTSTSRPMDYHCSRSARRLMFLLARTLAVGRHARHDDLFQHFVVVKAPRPQLGAPGSPLLEPPPDPAQSLKPELRPSSKPQPLWDHWAPCPRHPRPPRAQGR